MMNESLKGKDDEAAMELASAIPVLSDELFRRVAPAIVVRKSTGGQS